MSGLKSIFVQEPKTLLVYIIVAYRVVFNIKKLLRNKC